MTVGPERKSSKARGRWDGAGPAGLFAALLATFALTHLLVQPAAQTEASASDNRWSTVRSIAAIERSGFRSPDRRVWCYVRSSSSSVGCAGGRGPFRGGRIPGDPTYSAHLSSRGRVATCEVKSSSLTETCFVNFGYTAPILARGRWVQVGDTRCISTRSGIVCFRVRAPRRGYGFRINGRAAVKIKRHLSPGRLTIPASARNAFFKPSCDLSTRCSAQVTIRSGGKVLARGRYSIPAHSSRKVAIPLTAAGRAVLAGSSRIGAKLTIVDTHTGKRESIPVVLRR